MFFFLMKALTTWKNHLYRWSQVIEGEEEALPRIEPSKSYFWHYYMLRENLTYFLEKIPILENTVFKTRFP